VGGNISSYERRALSEQLTAVLMEIDRDAPFGAMAITLRKSRLRIEIHRSFGLLTLMYMGAVAASSLSPDLSTERSDPLVALVSNLLHIPAYAGLAYLLVKTLRGTRREHQQPPEAMALALIVAAVFAATSEWAQLFVPGRYASMSDFVLDVAGMLGAVFILRLAQRQRGRSVKPGAVKSAVQ
jgi:VanZ family protein